MKISGLVKLSLLDYPKKLAAVIFTQGCNLNCFYCHNKHLIPNIQGTIDKEYVLNFLKHRKDRLDGVVITGGEPCFQDTNSLFNFINDIKNIGYFVKIDTNGLYPKILKSLILNGLIDYIAMDIKMPLDKYDLIMDKSIEITNKICTNDILDSINITKSLIDYEFRTTLTNNFNEETIYNIMINIKNTKKYILQSVDKSEKGIKILNYLYNKTVSLSKEFNIQDYFIRKY